MDQAHARLMNQLGALVVTLNDRIFERMTDTSGLNLSDASTLITLGPNPDESAESLSRVVGRSHSATVRIIERLHTQGLVLRKPGADKRESLIRLSARGNRVRDKLVAARSEVLQEASQGLAEEQLRQLDAISTSLLTQMISNLEQAEHSCRFCDERVCDPCPIEDNVQSSPSAL